MSYPIITTDVSRMRPVFAQGAGENIKRYTQLKKMFQQGGEYKVLAEPNPEGPKMLKWCTEYEGEAVPYTQLSDQDKELAKGYIKYQVNNLYKAAFRQLYRDSMRDVADIFQVLDSCIEIPDYADIYCVQQPNGQPGFVIIRWGFIGDDFNSPSGLIKKLIPIKVDDVRIKVLKDSKPCPGTVITVSYNGQTSNLTTDADGYVCWPDVALGSPFTAYVDDPENTQEYICNASPEYCYTIPGKSYNMNLVVLNGLGKPMQDARIAYSYDGNTYYATTDAEGNACLPDIPEGAQVTCRYGDYSDTFVCSADMPRYTFTAGSPVDFAAPVYQQPVQPEPVHVPPQQPVAPAVSVAYTDTVKTKAKSKWRFLFWLIPLLLLLAAAIAFLMPAAPVPVARQFTLRINDATDHNRYVSGAVVSLRYGSQVISDTSDPSGVCRFAIPANMPDTVSASVMAADYDALNASVYIHTQDTTLYMAPVVKGFTLIVKDEKTGNPVSDAQVRLDYQDQSLQGISGSDGSVNFATVPTDSQLQLKVVIDAPGYDQFVIKLYFQKEKTVYLPEKSLDIRDIPVPCGSVIKSEGCHSTIQTVSLSEPEGTFKVSYKMNTVPDELIVYTGPASEINDSKIIYTTNGKVSGKGTVSIPYQTPDGIITVRVNGGDETTTQWEIKVFCPEN